MPVSARLPDFPWDTLAPFALRADKSYFFSPDRAAFLAYRVVGGVAIVSGDPIGPAVARETLVRSFIEFAHDRGWRVAVLGVSEECLGLYRLLGLRSSRLSAVARGSMPRRRNICSSHIAGRP